MVQYIQSTAYNLDGLSTLIDAISSVYGSLAYKDGVAAALWAAPDAAAAEAILLDWTWRVLQGGVLSTLLDTTDQTISVVPRWTVGVATPISETLITFQVSDLAAASPNLGREIIVAVNFQRDSFFAAHSLLTALPASTLVDNGDLPEGWMFPVPAAVALGMLEVDRLEAIDAAQALAECLPPHWHAYVDGTTVSAGHSPRQYRTEE